MHKEVLEQVRLALRESRINPGGGGRYTIEAQQEEKLRKNILYVRDEIGILGIFDDLDQKKRNKLSTSFWENFEKTMRNVEKGFSRGITKGEVDAEWKGEKVDFFDQYNMEMLLVEYHEAVALVLDWQQSLMQSTFSYAAKVIGIWEPNALGDLFIDERIQEILNEVDISMELDEIKEMFTGGRKLRIAGHSTKNPLAQIQKIGNNFQNVLTDENIQIALKEIGIDMEVDEIRSMFTKSKRIYFSIQNVSNPLDGVRQVGNNLKNVLTDENIQKKLKEMDVDMEIEEIQSIFTNRNKLAIAIGYGKDPLKAVRQVVDNFKNVLTDEKIQKVLESVDIHMDLQEVREIFSQYVRLEMSLKNILKPLDAVKRVGDNLRNKLTDQNIQKVLNDAGVDMELDEVKSVFTDGRKARLAMVNIANPLKAVVRVGDNLKNVLTDEKIQKVLDEEGAHMSIDEIKEVFKRWVRLYFAVNKSNDPLNGVKIVAHNINTLLTDKKIKNTFDEVGVTMSLDEINNIFTKPVRVSFAVFNFNDPLDGVRRAGINFQKVLTDENIHKLLQEEGVEMSIDEVRTIFTQRVKLHFAVHNISHPLDAARRLVNNFKNVLTDENIQKVLSDSDVFMTLDEISDLFTEGVKLHFAIKNIKDPFDGIKMMGENFKSILTDENIQKTFISLGIEMTLSDVKTMFPERTKKHLALHNRTNPLDAAVQVCNNLQNILTDENIYQVLKEKDIDISLDEVREIFTHSVRLSFSVWNISDPMLSVMKFAHNVKNILTDQNIHRHLNESGVKITMNEVKDIFHTGNKLDIALSNLNTPLSTINRVMYNLKNVLTDENIYKALLENDFEISLKEVSSIFTQRRKIYIAITNISDPLDYVQKLIYNLKDVLTYENIQNELQKAEIEIETEDLKVLLSKGKKIYFAMRNSSDPLPSVVCAMDNLQNILTDENIQKKLKSGGIEMSLEEIQAELKQWQRFRFAYGYQQDPLDACLRYIKGEIACSVYYEKDNDS
ncbi:hypothetical protein KKD70_02200 [Patescibacteria group bacterium]|nr:hypothetical protein [Patescibacteria group bacterium]